MFKRLRLKLQRKDSVLKMTNEFLKNENERLKKDLEEARNLKTILELLQDKTSMTITGGSGISAYSICDGDWSVRVSDDVPRYVEDLFGGKVIKQEANKAIIIKEDGEIKTGLTKSSCDKGRAYKLVQE